MEGRNAGEPVAPTKSKRQRRRQGGRQHQLKLRLDDAQHEALLVRAAAVNLSRQAYLLESALAPDRRSVAERRAVATQFSVLVRELKAIGNNVNQLAMVANASGHIAGGTAEALASITRLEERLAEAIEGLG